MMKHHIRMILSLFFVTVFCVNCWAMTSDAAEIDIQYKGDDNLFEEQLETGITTSRENVQDIIYQFVECVNEKNVEKYISLFPTQERDEMKAFVELMGVNEFFAEESRSIIGVRFCYEYVPEINLEKFQESVAYYVTENVTYKRNLKRAIYPFCDGVSTYKYVLVKENGKWYIYSVSLLNDKSMNSLSTPTETFIYFTKSVNIAYYGPGTSGIYWNNYIKDVLPNEWTIWYYFYSTDYAYSTALASKMYGWYNTVNPKWAMAPYYACMKDNSDDQNYTVWSYDALDPIPKNAENTALTFIYNRALVNSDTGNIFEIHYHATAGSYHSGQMSASGCYSLAQSGSTYAEILHYYYDGSSYIGSDNTAEVVNY